MRKVRAFCNLLEPHFGVCTHLPELELESDAGRFLLKGGLRWEAQFDLNVPGVPSENDGIEATARAMPSAICPCPA